ncbi:benzoate/H(+) symporter BenE family transporter [Xanthomonas cerealis]|uniref:benzoate/H(+) symporter BenE family transporter n=1 Tax=Xanthomonas cerealis TaxID=3390025 RepID=UPI00057914C9|nr:benzoate/H(+) symporter BenE family transporter [Xanthomonas translucens]UKE47307.1 benzoate/H(+) symporter BenE family transporter [Xanthomonas translucens pv. cerealis]
MHSTAGRSLCRDASLAALVAGFVTVLVGFASSAVIVFQAARTLGASQAQIASWMWALAMFAVYLLGRRAFPRYAVIATFAVGIAIDAGSGMLHLETAQLRLARPVLVWPMLSWQALFGIALPLFMVTMASQNLPGVAVIRASGYAVPISPTIGWIGVVNTLLAPSGAYGLNLAAITAAICMGREAQEDPQRRYMASVFAGLFYLLIGLFGASVAALFAAFPKELVMAIAGIALFGTIGNSMAMALKDEGEREPALITFLVTASGLSLFGIGTASCGLLAGAATSLLWRRTR